MYGVMGHICWNKHDSTASFHWPSVWHFAKSYPDFLIALSVLLCLDNEMYLWYLLCDLAVAFIFVKNKYNILPNYLLNDNKNFRCHFQTFLSPWIYPCVWKLKCILSVCFVTTPWRLHSLGSDNILCHFAEDIFTGIDLMANCCILL